MQKEMEHSTRRKYFDLFSIGDTNTGWVATSVNKILLAILS